MKKFIKIFSFLLVFSFVFWAISFLPNKALAYSDGTLDTTFNIGTGVTGGTSLNNFVNPHVIQPDGKIIFAGNFAFYNGVSRNRLARINTDGTLDTSFNVGTGADYWIESISLQTDGKIIIAGNFASYNGVTRFKIARLNSNGTLDTSFNPGMGANNGIYDTVIQPDGKILIGGWFSSYNGVSRNRIARLNSNGTLDTSFNVGTGTDIYVQNVNLQPDGKIIIAGSFTSYNGTPISRIARLNSNGSLDTTFNPSIGPNSFIQVTYLQPDGKIIIAGDFSLYNGVSRNGIARINSDGSLDTTFNPGTGNPNVGINSNIIRSIDLQADGKIIIGGWFSSYNGVARNHIARINSDGSLDTSFNPGTGTNNFIHSVSLQPDGKIIIGGWFSSYNNINRNGIVRLASFVNQINTAPVATNVVITGSPNVGQTLTGHYTYSDTENDLQGTSTFKWYRGGVVIPGANSLTYTTNMNDVGQLIQFEVTPIALTGVLVGLPVLSPGIVIVNPIIPTTCSDGTLDISFNAGTGPDNFVYATALQPDGKILIGGAFTSYNGTARNHIARLNSNGTLDTSFNVGIGADAWIKSIVVQPDGKILIGGGFTSYDGNSVNRIARLNPDGVLDSSFGPGTGADDWVQSISLQSDDKIIIGGTFLYYDGIARSSIARLNPDGSLDTSFDPGSGASGWIYSTALQPDNKILIGGWFTAYNGTARNRIARLNSDGSLDVSFKPGTGANSWIQSVYFQPDGRILIGGDFTSYNGVSRNRIARLNSNGTLDTTFKPGTGANSWLQSISLQPDNKIIIGGGFTAFNGTVRNRIARLNSDGSLDTSFNPGTGANNWIYPNILEPNCKIIIGGHFTSFNGVAKNYIARLGNTILPVVPSNITPAVSNIAQRTLKIKTVGDDVRNLQTYLNNKLKINLKADGIFGTLTKKAVMQFQMANALMADGIFGPLTKSKIK